MSDIDLHTHTRFFHQFEGRPTPFDEFGFRMNVAVARSRNLDAIAVTNHDYYTSFDVDTGDLAIIPGIEVSTTEGHLLVIGPDPPDWTVPGEMTPQETVDAAHERGCAVVMAHPFRSGTVKDADVAVDAVEVNGKHPQTAQLVEELANDRNLPVVGGSDPHYPIEIGRVVTNLAVDELTPETVVTATKAGETDFEIVARFPDQYTRKLYAAIHRVKSNATPS